MSAVIQFKTKCAHGWEGYPSRCGKCRSEARKESRVGVIDMRKTVVLTENGRECLKCCEAKSWNEFAKDVHGYNGKTATCKNCRNEKFRKQFKYNPNVRRGSLKERPDRLKRIYGVTWDFVVQTLANQFGRCANLGCCKEISLETKGTKGNRAVIDHCHETGQFRALLCIECNAVLGTLETKASKVLGLMDYMNKHNKKSHLTATLKYNHKEKE